VGFPRIDILERAREADLLRIKLPLDTSEAILGEGIWIDAERITYGLNHLRGGKPLACYGLTECFVVNV